MLGRSSSHARLSDEGAGLALVIAWLREARQESRRLEISNPPAGLMAMARICDVEGLIQSVLGQQRVGPARQIPDTPA